MPATWHGANSDNKRLQPRQRQALVVALPFLQIGPRQGLIRLLRQPCHKFGTRLKRHKFGIVATLAILLVLLLVQHVAILDFGNDKNAASALQADAAILGVFVRQYETGFKAQGNGFGQRRADGGIGWIHGKGNFIGKVQRKNTLQS